MSACSVRLFSLEQSFRITIYTGSQGLGRTKMITGKEYGTLNKIRRTVETLDEEMFMCIRPPFPYLEHLVIYFYEHPLSTFFFRILQSTQLSSDQNKKY